VSETTWLIPLTMGRRVASDAPAHQLRPSAIVVVADLFVFESQTRH
jgi:hypothetical protein